MAEDPREPPLTELSDDVAILLGDRRRIVMLQQLSSRAITSEELGSAMGLSPAATRYHLRLLRQHGWIYVAETYPVGGSFENRWAAVPGVDWQKEAVALNALCDQRQTPADE